MTPLRSDVFKLQKTSEPFQHPEIKKELQIPHLFVPTTQREDREERSRVARALFLIMHFTQHRTVLFNVL